MTVSGDHNTPGTDDIQLRWCNACHTDHPVDAFAWKHRERGIRHSRCRDAVRAYNQQHYANNKEHRYPHIKQRSKRLRAQLETVVNDARHGARCDTCHTADNLTADRGDAPSLWQLVRNEVAVDQLYAALEDPQLRWRCTSCRGAELGHQQRGRGRNGRTTTISAAIVDHLNDHRTATLEELVSGVEQRTGQPVNRGSVANTAGRLTRHGHIKRVGPGQYATASASR